ncbi:MAG: 3-dehydroquinate synthase [Acidobacteriota bacterium]|nr:3-dehydroquinate synthase [Acidobacteriota bacterium]
MSHRLSLRHPGGETPILVGEGALGQARPELSAWLAGRTAFLVSTPRVLSLHGHRLEPLKAAAARWVVLEVEEGEPAKTVASAGRLWDAMLAAGGKRDSRLLAFGGGSVGDLGGFAAGCFLRGIDFVQLPTTLLAQVDAAIGGKTGVDLTGGKNTVGLFHHPRLVVSDTSVLPTLPRGELRSGLVEVVKMAALLDPPLLTRVEGELDRLLAGDPEALGPVVAAAAAAKIGVVHRDPTEQGDRRLLNFGHTLGHALESAGGYSGLRHGEAVAYGLLFALRLAARRGLAKDLAPRLTALLSRFELPPISPISPMSTVLPEELLAHMARDKKATERGLTWVLPAALGEGRMVDGIGREELLSELQAFLADPFGPLAFAD